MTAERDPAAIPWGKLGVDFVIESTGVFTRRADLEKHLAGGAKKVILTVPAQGRDRRHDRRRRQRRTRSVPSTAWSRTPRAPPTAWRRSPRSSTTRFGIESGLMTTVHAYTNDQRLADVPHKDLRRSRAAAENIIPTTTGAATAVGKVLPRLKGKLDGLAMRVPVPDGSVVDLVCKLRADAVARRGQRRGARRGGRPAAPASSSTARRPLVSTDIVGNSALLDLRRAVDPGRRRLGQGGGLVRQRVGLLEPGHRPVDASRLPRSSCRSAGQVTV